MDPFRESTRYIRPGSTDPSILYLQPRHRSEALWHRHDMPTVRPWRTKSATFGYPPPTFVSLLISFGFYGASQAGFFPYDWHMVTALIMWWWTETHTFRMAIGIGETTITLEDVAIQLGLPIDGKEDVDSTNHNWAQLCQELLGKTPEERDLEDEELHQIVQAYILRLIGGFLMPDTSGNKVSLICLPLLRNLEEAGRYSWGSAVLAYLFHEMCEATRWDCEKMGGCAHLLLAWAWDRFPSLARRLTGCKPRLMSVQDEAAQYPVPAPLSARYVMERLLYYHEGVMHTQRHGVRFEDGQHVRGQCILTLPWPNRQLLWVPMWEQRWNRLVDAPKTMVQLASHSRYMRWYKEITCKWVHPVGARSIVNGETYGVIADRVYEQLVPAIEIAHIYRHMQSLNVHTDPKGAGDHEPTCPHSIQPTEDGKPTGHEAGGDDHQDDDDDELPELEPHDFDALGAVLRTPPPSILQTQGESSSGSSTFAQHCRPREDDDEDTGAQPLVRQCRPRRCGTGSHYFGHHD
ncbi:serine/threonine-protein phosphatase 7 long form-like protein [Senna tora]|uniref:Serine/threonine-protein phosphatase 7 long form-like protein n=1 Tax=Senna tora TaxID=362788 RepID=A0A834TRN9_9FABA|nr:serine/threonine-protein phosphatase 7 long form-like protein [Senna tora]